MTERPWQTDNWWTSPYNHIPEVSRALTFPEKVVLHDATLRDGEQTPGVVFRSEEKVRIAALLQELGVARIEAGMPAVSEDDARAIRAIARMGGNAQIMGFVRAIKSDLDQAKDCGCSGVIIEVPIGKPKLDYQFGWTWQKVLDVSVEAIKYSKSLGLYTVYFPYDTTRADPVELENVLSGVARDAKPDAIGVVDTVGCALPEAIAFLVRKVKSLVGVPVEIHTHNDLGMAVVNSIYAVAAGADVVHVCVNGMGERTGNAPLEEVAVALKVLCGVDTGIRFEKLKEVSRIVRELSGFPMAPNKPVVGDGNFVRESGIGIDTVMKYPLAMFSLNPYFVGSFPGVVLGKKSGVNSIKMKAEEMGIQLSEEEARIILNRVKELGIAKKGTVSGAEFAEIVNEVKLSS
ncbi:MAG TPA: 2-isopropylmalate synthase [Firmicutes bacterium]|nr:2-isopropylmalate synthase [Candidatus Fermentithermobacillaceae bacterium]